MRFYHGRFIRTDIWREGDYLDLWSVPHFLSGLVLGIAIFYLGFDFRAGALIAFLLLVAYEMFEVIAEIEETRMNRVLDVVVGLSSCLPALYFAPRIGPASLLVVFLIAGAADAVLSFMGWRASQKAAELERNLRAEWRRERDKMRLRRHAFAARFRRKPPLT